MRTSWLLVAGIALLGCDKGPSASGKLEAKETSLLSRLPASGDLVFGGNLMKFQAELAKSPLAKLSKLAESVTPGLNAWQDCLAAQKPEQMLGTVDASKGISLRYVMTGIGISDLEKCAKAGNLTFKTDSDGKFISISMPGMKDASMGFLAMADGVYGRQSLDISQVVPQAHTLHRASFEADIAVAKDDNANGNNRLVSTMELADRSKSMWFAGSGAKTPFADQVKDVYGFMNLAGGIHIDVTVQLLDTKIADQVMRSVDQAKEMAGFLGSDAKKVINAIDIKREGTQLRVVVKVSNATLEKLMDELGPLMNMGGGMGRRDRPDFKF